MTDETKRAHDTMLRHINELSADLATARETVKRLRKERDDWRKVAFQVAKQRLEAQDDADRWKCYAAATMGDMPNPDPGRLMRESQREMLKLDQSDTAAELTKFKRGEAGDA